MVKVFLLAYCLLFAAVIFAKERVISLAPNLTEIIYMLNKGEVLVGRSGHCDYPEAAKNLAISGDFDSPNVEKSILLEPTMVLVTGLKDYSVKKILEAAGIKVYVIKCDSISEYLKTVSFLGKHLGAEKVAKQETARIKTYLERLRRKGLKTPSGKKPKVFIEIASTPLMTAGNRSFLNEYIRLAGGINIAGSENKSYFQVSKEFVLLKNPDVIIAPGLSDEAIKELKSSSTLGWNKIGAAKKGRVYNKIDASLLFELGPRMFDAIKQLNTLFYP